MAPAVANASPEGVAAGLVDGDAASLDVDASAADCAADAPSPPRAAAQDTMDQQPRSVAAGRRTRRPQGPDGGAHDGGPEGHDCAPRCSSHFFLFLA